MKLSNFISLILQFGPKAFLTIMLGVGILTQSVGHGKNDGGGIKRWPCF